jgi:hypothetical protein
MTARVILAGPRQTKEVLMSKLLLFLAVVLACSSASAQREYQSAREARNQRNFDICVNHYTRGQRVSRREMRRIHEDCRRRLAAREHRRYDHRPPMPVRPLNPDRY